MKQVKIRLDIKTHEDLKKYAAVQRLSVNWIVTEMILKALYPENKRGK